MNMLATALRRLAPLGALPAALCGPLVSAGFAAAVCGVALTTTTAARAQDAPANPANLPLVSPLFTDNMVLQRGRPVLVWGWAEAGKTVTVGIAGKSANAVCDAQGKWTAKLPALPVGGPYTMTVSVPQNEGGASPGRRREARAINASLPRGSYTNGVAGPRAVTLVNILVGDVWVCSGQSNMEFGIGNLNNAAQEIAAADYPQIRLFTVKKAVAQTPQQTLSGSWDVCTPRTVTVGAWNGFSAVAYFFGRELYNNLKVPIGLIHTSWGGTVAEAWTSGDALQTMPDYKAVVTQRMDAQRAGGQNAHAFADRMTAWYSQNDPGTQNKWDLSAFEDADWKPINLPGAWEQSGIAELANFDGIVWFRREFAVPDGAQDKPCQISLGSIDDRDTVWVNGIRIGGMDDYAANRVYAIPPGVLKAGRNVVAVRVLDTGGAGGFTGQPTQMRLAMAGSPGMSLAGEWKYKISAPLANTKAVPMPITDNPNVPTVLYNGMIAPLLPYGIKGAIWYQGESNAGRAYQYRTLLPTMIEDWRAHWNEGKFPFYIVQLANYQQAPAQPGDSDWAELREAQSLTASHVYNTGQAVTIDIGDANDIHPKDKQDVGKRLALAALAQTYGAKIEYSGPQYRSMKVEGDKIRLTFTHGIGGLVARPSDQSAASAMLQGFAVAGEDRKFVWADAKIDGNAVVVSAPTVPHPVAVRYAWANNPVCNLYNKAGLPASPFRTDDWPGVTVKNK